MTVRICFSRVLVSPPCLGVTGSTGWSYYGSYTTKRVCHNCWLCCLPQPCLISFWSLRSQHSFQFPCPLVLDISLLFFCSIILVWNLLPSSVVNSSTLMSFKSAFHKHFSSIDIALACSSVSFPFFSPSLYCRVFSAFFLLSEETPSISDQLLDNPL